MAEDKKAAALARLAAAKAKRADAEDKGAEEREIANILRDAEMNEALAAATEEFGADRVAAITIGSDFVVVTAPKYVEYRRWMDTAGNKSEDALALIAGCLYPRGADATAKFARIADRYPGIIGKALAVVVKLAGAVGDAVEGK